MRRVRYLYYCILLRRESKGGYTVNVPMLPDSGFTYGETIDDAIARAKDAIELSIGDFRKKGDSRPERGCWNTTLTIESQV
ncbi:type II toxin-antitoxin system HicB family antitoxin [Methanosphaerula palustris]|uniref:HicB-like antitoxin of toxin-antitoxin system domain-containing protein n=1 Tax=Methanosphaerula palustris (strain ATCC BAA-1556 / DSM 19958 / E1-9c) TaxID=521011 RepID=B8GJV2_METPE|nr:type II toxin-antitoxin system HicB family antitoxin [Methanosphaerula palustris]ACL15756.1 protein of unknown function UPF0150 [Methanosphaerula palustris E1-9c]